MDDTQHSSGRSDAPTKHCHIIAMDGGGIYGLATAQLLRQLCEGDAAFMAKDKIGDYLFTGTSAGALNALLLAAQDDPRQFLLDGGLEQFWKHSMVFEGPEDPWSWYWSLFGVTPWFGSRRFSESLQRIFGDRSIAELPHNVLVVAFDYAGVDAPEIAGGKGWAPRSFANDRQNPLNSDREAWKVGYAVAAPAGYRAFMNGLGDGGATLPSPELWALTRFSRAIRQQQIEAAEVGEELPEVTVSELSIGVCSTAWHYWHDEANFLGYHYFWNVWPTNPQLGNWYPPIYDFNISAPTATTNEEIEDLLGPAYFRLNPGLLGPPHPTPPVLVAMLWSRNPMLLEWLINEIDKAVETPLAKAAVEATLGWLQSPAWLEGQPFEVVVDRRYARSTEV